jgi:hypothetical protein
MVSLVMWGRPSACGGPSGRQFGRIPKCLQHYHGVIVRRRRLPHLVVVGQPLFVTFRLKGTLPAHRAFPSENLTSGKAFVAMDRLLDEARSGPAFLRQPAIAEIVAASIQCGEELGHYEMHACVVMPNHVHLLLTPHISVSKPLCSLKGASATRANVVLGRSGAFLAG